MEPKKIVFTVRAEKGVGDGRYVEYWMDAPDGRLGSSFVGNELADALGIELQAGDEVEVTMRVLTRVVTKREPL